MSKQPDAGACGAGPLLLIRPIGAWRCGPVRLRFRTGLEKPEFCFYPAGRSSGGGIEDECCGVATRDDFASFPKPFLYLQNGGELLRTRSLRRVFCSARAG